MKIVVLDGHAVNPGDLSWESIEKLGNITVYPRTLPEETLARVKDAEIILTNKTIICEKIINNCPNLKYIGVLATGYNVVDLQAAKKAGIMVTNIPGYSTPSVSQFVFALLLEACSRVQEHNESVHAGDWIKCPDFTYWKYPLVELDGKTLGIFGFGSIGKSVAKIADAFGMKVICYTRTPSKIPSDSYVKSVSFDELLSESDVITLHSPLTEETKNLINTNTINKMKDGVIVINTARGPLVNEQDMTKALEERKIACYCSDVISAEPMEEDNPLYKAPNCIITPHIAWATKEARTRLMEIATNNISSFIQDNPINVVN